MLAGLVAVAVGGVQPADANPNELALEVLSVQASLAPDGRSMSFDLLTRCDRKATVLDALVSAVQTQASEKGRRVQAVAATTCAYASDGVM